MSLNLDEKSLFASILWLHVNRLMAQPIEPNPKGHVLNSTLILQSF